MKTVKALLILFTMLVSTTMFAQNSKLSGKEFTVVINKMDNPSPETQITDVITFDNSTVQSKEYQKSGFESGKFIEKNADARTAFEATLTGKTAGSVVYNGQMEDNHIWGTVVITRQGQAPETYSFRGMTTQLWNAMQNSSKQ
jgi:hypothetical protein